MTLADQFREVAARYRRIAANPPADSGAFELAIQHASAHAAILVQRTIEAGIIAFNGKFRGMFDLYLLSPDSDNVDHKVHAVGLRSTAWDLFLISVDDASCPIVDPLAFRWVSAEEAAELATESGRQSVPSLQTQPTDFVTRCENYAVVADWLADKIERHAEDPTAKRAKGAELPLPENSPQFDYPRSRDEDDRLNTAHGIDFRSVRWFGEAYEFTSTQAACVKVLWEHWEQRTSAVGETSILESAGAGGERLRDIFDKGKHPAWGTMIVDSRKGAFRLQPKTTDGTA